MTLDQGLLFGLMGLVLLFLLWGRWRYDLVAFLALVIALVVGLVPTEEAFSGFGHPATVVIALVLIVSRGLSNSGVIDLAARTFLDSKRSLTAHIGVMASVSAVLSAIMNNVAALAMLMPLDLQAAAKAKRAAGLTLMPLSFATILGGLVTLIGTPPNIVVAAFRERSLGESFAMFDFAPVGGLCAIVGVIYVTFVGWRLIPSARQKQEAPKPLFDLEGYIVEIAVPEKSPVVGKQLHELDETVEEEGVTLLGLIRGEHRLPGLARREWLQPGDLIVLEGGPEAIEKVVGALELDYAESRDGETPEGDLAFLEVVVQEGARIARRSVRQVHLLRLQGVELIGVSRQGKAFRERVKDLTILPGDVLLLLGPSDRLNEVANWLGALPLAERGLQPMKRDKAWLAVGIFAAAIGLATSGVLYLPVALAAAVGLYALLEIVPLRQLYESVEWPVIVLLGALIPIGTALEESGGTALIAEGIVSLSAGAPVFVVLTAVMLVTMTLSDVLNNTATAVISAPIAVDVANSLGVSPDPFLMAVAVGASCAFLTPIGHKNNTLILGPGGYSFGDYWRMGLPLEILVVAVAIPMILLVWPL